MKTTPRPYLYLLFLLLVSHAAVAQQKETPKSEVQFPAAAQLASNKLT
jgi:hypothetical protein